LRGDFQEAMIIEIASHFFWECKKGSNN